ncbi:organic cation transporter protein-like isoform X1 [Branchiostoma floridae x Branchiostoma belcheri]
MQSVQSTSTRASARCKGQRVRNLTQLLYRHSKMVDFDGALVYLGAFGKYQKLIYCLTCVLTLPVSMHMLAMAFLDARVAFHCNVPEIRHAEPGTENYSCALNYSIPWEQDKETREWQVSGCQRYIVVNSSLVTVECPFDAINETALGYFDGVNTSSCNHGYWYDTSQYHSSIFTEFDLVCDSSELNQFAQSMFMVGVLVGAVGSGQLSDMIGRKKTVFLGILIQLLFGVAVAFSPNYTLFVVFRAIVGASTSAVLLSSFVIGTELVAPSMRTWTGTLIEIFFAIGFMLLALIAYFIRDWRTLQLVISVPNAVFLFAYPLIIESPRWLLSKGRDEEVAAIIQKAAKVNGVTLPDEVFTTKDTDIQKPKGERTYTVIDLVRTPNMAKKSLLISFNWLVISLVYYGLSLNTSNLGGDDYLNFFISGAVEIPAYISSVYIVDTFGRPKTHASYMIIGAVGCIICPFLTVPYLPEHLNPLSITLAMIGKFGVTACFNTIFIWTAELYPTMVRNVGVGASTMFARVGGIISPYMEFSKSVWGPLPYIIFGALSFLAALAALLLPETLGAELPVTLEDGENFGKKKQTRSMSFKANGSDANQPYSYGTLESPEPRSVSNHESSENMETYL